VLDGAYSHSVERSVPFSICRGGSGFTAEAIAGPYHAIRAVQPGGENCEGAMREVAVDFGRRPGTIRFRIRLDRAQRHSCRHTGGRDSCLIDFGLLGEGARDRWTVSVHKRSEGRAHISFAISFIGVRG
jgi:hypothetical protein